MMFTWLLFFLAVVGCTGWIAAGNRIHCGSLRQSLLILAVTGCLRFLHDLAKQPVDFLIYDDHAAEVFINEAFATSAA